MAERSQALESLMARALYTWIAWETGRFAEAIAGARTIVDQEPTTAQWWSDITWGYWSSGDSTNARITATKATTVDTNFYEAFDIFSLVEADAGNHAEAMRLHNRAKQIAGGDYWTRQLSEGGIRAAVGDTVGVRRLLNELRDDPRP